MAVSSNRFCICSCFLREQKGEQIACCKVVVNSANVCRALLTSDKKDFPRNIFWNHCVFILNRTRAGLLLSQRETGDTSRGSNEGSLTIINKPRSEWNLSSIPCFIEMTTTRARVLRARNEYT